MSILRKLIHGSTAQRMSTTPALGQVGSDDNLGQVALGDGVTPGGILMARDDKVVKGPAVSVANRMAEFSGTTGRLLQDSGVAVSAFIKTLLDDADAATSRATLGIATGTVFTTGNSPSSLSTTGYQRLPSGFIIQWGTFSGGDVGNTFPIAFPNACVSVSAAIISGA